MSYYKSNDSQKEFFNQIIDTYRIGNEANIDLLLNLRNAVSEFIEGDILDIGNGGLINFDIDKAKSVILADIVLDPIKNPKIIKGRSIVELDEDHKKLFNFVEADVLKMPFADKSFDRVLMFNVAHHLSVESSKDSVLNINYAIDGIKRILRDDGIFLIWETCPSFPIKLAQDAGYNLLFWILKKFNRPLPYFLARKNIKKLLEKKGFNLILVKEIEWGDKVYSPIFPKILAPRWLWNKILRTYLFVAKKN
ncbi:MAG: class I SAM-dependent methyltransferase [Parcubacteria group bacterium]|nr:class I SAM-dependent methyltransferase [Parcubacteria group bacterium]MCR4342515.1 class I SAM-dependent methyltransferase [Patescibacteria group bacterium]